MPDGRNRGEPVAGTTRTAGSASGLEKRASGNAGTALQADSARNCSRRASSRTWPSRRTQPRCAGRSGTPRPTRPAPGTSGCTCSPVTCPNPGSRRMSRQVQQLPCLPRRPHCRVAAFCARRPGARQPTFYAAHGSRWGARWWEGARLLLAETGRPAGLTGRKEKQIDPHSVTIPLRPRREYGVFDSGGRPSHREARPTQVSFDLRVDVPARQRHAASHLAPTAVWSRNDGRTA